MQIKLNETQENKLISMLMQYTSNNPDDKEMLAILNNIMFGEEFMQAKDKGTLKQYECIEDGERFIIEALDYNDAREKATVWNAEVIGEVK